MWPASLEPIQNFFQGDNSWIPNQHSQAWGPSIHLDISKMANGCHWKKMLWCPTLKIRWRFQMIVKKRNPWQQGADYLWSASDDALLKTFIDKYPNNWALIAECFSTSRCSILIDAGRRNGVLTFGNDLQMVLPLWKKLPQIQARWLPKA